MIELTEDPIDVATLVARAQRPTAGAVVLFLGITREFTDGQQTSSLTYEAYAPMAELEMTKLEAAARERWPLAECLLSHRTGEVPLSEASVAVVVSSAHRPEAFEAARWLIDELKRSAPIWKQEHRPDGNTQWVHPAPRQEASRRA